MGGLNLDPGRLSLLTTPLVAPMTIVNVLTDPPEEMYEKATE
jgi:hypothetical protein